MNTRIWHPKGKTPATRKTRKIEPPSIAQKAEECYDKASGEAYSSKEETRTFKQQKQQNIHAEEQRRGEKKRKMTTKPILGKTSDEESTGTITLHPRREEKRRQKKEHGRRKQNREKQTGGRHQIYGIEQILRDHREKPNSGEEVRKKIPPRRENCTNIKKWKLDHRQCTNR